MIIIIHDRPNATFCDVNGQSCAPIKTAMLRFKEARLRFFFAMGCFYASKSTFRREFMLRLLLYLTKFIKGINVLSLVSKRERLL